MLLLYLCLTGILAGFIGSVVGIGGGVLIVPVLTLLLNIPIHLAIGTSIVSVLVTSLAASIRYFRKNVINIPLGLTMEIPTTIGGIIGSLAVAFLRNNILFLIFGCFLIAAGIFTFIKNKIYRDQIREGSERLPENGSSGKNSVFDSSYYDESYGKTVDYKIKKVIPGSAISVFAGILSGLLGVGGGVVKVPVMHLIMNAPLKVATSTSIYMIGITAVVSSIIHFYNGFINPAIVIPVVAGVLVGAVSGSFTALRIKSRYIALIIMIIFSLIGILMFLRGSGVIEY
jgi:uncharacterized membrane protein YfcA